MTVFYGLGNNAQKYFSTKHNAGRLVLEKYLDLQGLKFQEKTDYFYAKSGDFYFLISKGFMNNSGASLLSFLKYFKLNTNSPDFNLLILQDDSDQLIGKQKLTQAGGSAGHKGIADIYKKVLNLNLETSKIYRLKIGIRPEKNNKKSQTFVLSSVNNFEKKHYQIIAEKLSENQQNFKPINLSMLQNVFNSDLVGGITNN